jgi:hypothetical protein
VKPKASVLSRKEDMKRIHILLGLIVLVIWQTESDISSGNLTPRSDLLGSVAIAQEMCCVEGTSPHDECVNGMCVSVDGCGVSDCSACTGCDPDGSREAECLQWGWNWDPGSCTCYEPPSGCDPGARDSCYWQGWEWDEFFCSCYPPPCYPGEPVQVGGNSIDVGQCVDMFVYELCTYTTLYYEQYCQDGSLYASWTEEYGYCNYYYWEYCDWFGG